ncbi:MAG: rRNA methyltransferase [Flavobacteriaceae bacterium]|nr:rRNA methyltransferase [Flavobacteriaceae bacterium]|tara:strand:+ start:40334 stop:40855 length:522 start_codon:yes stop_codon:yes gene_type:complete
MEQLNHYTIENQQQKFPIAVVCDALRTPENIGMCFRVCEGFGVQHIYLHETSPNLENRIVKKTARNTINQIKHDYYSDFNQLVEKLKNDGYAVVGIEITDKSQPISSYDFTKWDKVAFVMGNERYGIADLQLIDETVHIPMYGRNSSMNVIHSLNIVLYEATNQLVNTNLTTN